MDMTYDNPLIREHARLVHALSRDLELIKQLSAPSIRDIAAAPVIEGWIIGQRPEPALIGTVGGHPEIADGPIVTSRLAFLDPVAGYARTLSRWYRLGSPG